MPLTLETRLVDLGSAGLPGVGVKVALKLAAAVGAYACRPAADATVEDLLLYAPMRYEDRSNLRRVAELFPGVEAALDLEVRIAGSYPLKGGRHKIFEVTAVDASGQIRAFWWNQVYLSKVFVQGTRVILYGRWNRGRNACFEVENPEYEIISEDGDAGVIHTGRIVPIYRKLGDFRTRQLRRIVSQILDCLERPAEILPAATRSRHGLTNRYSALRDIHFPPARADLSAYERGRAPAQVRLIFEEFFWLSMALAHRRAQRLAQPKGPVIEINQRVREAVRSILPFHPTDAQKRALKQIVDDMRSVRPMNRLLQGEVGSGKTIVAVQAMVVAVENGYQAALMAPTEILAEQHARNLRGILAGSRYRVECLTGSQPTRTRREVRAALAAGEIDIAVGTHALIQKGVSFANLGFVVIDEQHRFGVMQRAELIRLGYNPDVLVMTATPIPRSLAMTVYGDLDVSVIDQLPPGRTAVRTTVRRDAQRKAVHALVEQELRAGRQAYVVYPLVEESAKSDLLAATEMAARLQSQVFPQYTVGLLHGRMKSEDKDNVMRRFLAHEIDVLVATTVIEVGVDIPNATVMIVEHAERFGLSQLHQLRGRVGRGAAQSFCVLIASDRRTSEARERLAIMEATSDGFLIAEKDLEIRGPGEVMGTRQHGEPLFRIGNLVRDRHLLEAARDEARLLLSEHGNTRSVARCIAYVRELPRFSLSTVG
jgi:ATP-dependent DNA helicase RecG